MEKLTLELSWEHCLAMWKWVSEKHVKGGASVGSLKEKWLKDNGFKSNDLKYDCFFCQYNKENGGKPICLTKEPNCQKCPARLVSLRFCCEGYDDYDWQESPKKFYKKLVELHERFLEEQKLAEQK